MPVHLSLHLTFYWGAEAKIFYLKCSYTREKSYGHFSPLNLDLKRCILESINKGHKLPFQQLQIANSVISENINEAQPCVLLRIIGAWRKKEHKDYFHQVTSAQAQESDLHCKRWSLVAEWFNKRFQKHHQAVASLGFKQCWAHFAAPWQIKALLSSRSAPKFIIFHKKAPMHSLSNSSTCQAQDDLSTQPSVQSWSLTGLTV